MDAFEELMTMLGDRVMRAVVRIDKMIDPRDAQEHLEELKRRTGRESVRMACYGWWRTETGWRHVREQNMNTIEFRNPDFALAHCLYQCRTGDWHIENPAKRKLRHEEISV